MRTEPTSGKEATGRAAGAGAGNIVNGVDVSQLKEKIRMISENPELGRSRFRAVNRWVNGGHNRATIGDFFAAGQENAHEQSFALEIDEPPLLLGEDLGANPVEYVLAALSGCMTTSIVYFAAAQGIEIDEIESRFEGELDLRGFLGLSDEVRNGYQNIRVNFRIKADVPQEKIDQLVQLAQERSPVFDIVSHPVSVTATGEKVEGSLH